MGDVVVGLGDGNWVRIVQMCEVADLPHDSHIIFEVSMKAEINSRWLDDPFAAGKWALRRWRRYSAANVTDACSRMR